MPPVLLEYQKKWAMDNSKVKICQKSRRIGLSWADAGISALEASKANGSNTFYVGYNKEMAEQYIEDVAHWAKCYNLLTESMENEQVLDDTGKPIMVYRIKFASGYKVIALSSKPANLRAKKGNIVIDEAAFHDDLPELLKAGLAILMWGGSLRIISTHNGIDNHFNEIIKETYEGKYDYSIHKYDIEDALKDGLYKRICLVNELEWSQSKQAQWLKDLIRQYGVGADEELFCIPSDIKGGGKLFKREWFKFIEPSQLPERLYGTRFWDLASTARDIKDVEQKGAFYTAGVLIAKYDDNYYVLDFRAKQLSPAETDDFMLETAKTDGYYHRIRWELEGGSAGLRDAEHIKRILKGYDAEPVKPRGDKVARAKPYASECKRGNVSLVKADWNQRYIDALYGFDGTPKILTNDATDASSGAYDEEQIGQIASILGT